MGDWEKETWNRPSPYWKYSVLKTKEKLQKEIMESFGELGLAYIRKWLIPLKELFKRIDHCQFINFSKAIYIWHSINKETLTGEYDVFNNFWHFMSYFQLPTFHNLFRYNDIWIIMLPTLLKDGILASPEAQW